ncbi:hypothetical protein [Methylobacterium symbioticum]|uniref:Cupin 2 conserved barrel domain-containing protein n=1 Tax=Methylobacterium symbioticum TaxID=2584084 RepID=A0A509E6M5_9HYPH|nr:hypothetical protein [Methylobacterium symbioticum]VUD69821.1 hypothetical protein MET9862_00380 [Methylobacterium symbioticum]
MTSNPAGTVRVIDSAVDCPEIPIVTGGGNAHVVMWPGNGAIYRTFHLISLDLSGKTIPLQHSSDSVYYIVSGKGTVTDVAAGVVSELTEGAMVHIDRGDTYMFAADGISGMRLLGGPCPADPDLYATLRASK